METFDFEQELNDIDNQINSLILKRKMIEVKMIKIVKGVGDILKKKKIDNKPKSPNIWDNWRSVTDAVNWALTILPGENPERLRDMLLSINGDFVDIERDTKGQIWVNLILAMSKHKGNEQKYLFQDESKDK